MGRKLLLPAILLVTVVVWIEYYRYAVGDRELTKSQLETRLRRQYLLTDIALSEHRPGQFTGSGNNSHGASFRFAINQDATSRTIFASWEDPLRGITDDHQHSIEFIDVRPAYLALGAAYLLWAGIVIGTRKRSSRLSD